MAIVQISQITQRKGLQENLPQLAGAEFGWSVDERRLFIGNGTLAEGAPVVGNTEILTEFSDIIQFNTNYTYKGLAAGYTVQTGPTAGDPVIQSLQSWLDQFASVKDFGATGDGVTDDTDAINRALYQLFCRELNPQIRRSLFFPAGVYRVTDTILIPPFATLWGEGPDNSVITLDTTMVSYVARTTDSLQQTGVNIGSNGALTPQYVTVQNLGFRNLDPVTDVFLVEDAVNCSFKGAGFYGPLTLSDLTTEANLTTGVAFGSSVSLVCDQILFDGCFFSGTTYGVNTDQQTKGVTFANGKFDTLYRGIQLGAGAVVNGGPTGTRITNNLFDNIYAEGIVFGTVSLNATGHNIFYDVGDHFGGVTTPYTAVIDIQSNNNVSIGDMFARGDAYSNAITPGAAYPRITLNKTQSIATTNGVETAQGTYVRQSGTVATLVNNTVSATTIFTVNAVAITSFNINYAINRAGAYRTGVISVTSSGTGALTYSDNYSENQTTGIVLSVTQATNTVSVKYTATNSGGNNANFSYSITHLA